jgi:uncharacterized protein (TIGR01777 family)
MAKTKKILMTGGTGFIGSKLSLLLMEQGFHVSVLTRQPHNHITHPGKLDFTDSLNSLDTDANWYGVINLAGEPLDSSRWNESTKKQIIESRTQTTASLNRWMQSIRQPPEVYLSASAIGWYGHWQNEVLTEDSSFNDCFSHDLCAAWEQAALDDVPEGCRVCIMRLGIVLGMNGGPFPEMLLPAKFGASTMGNGNQWWSWIHIDDATGIFLSALEDERYQGIVNCTAPEPVTQKQFSKLLAKTLRRPAIFPVPGCAMRLLLGQFADEILLKGQRVMPAIAKKRGYPFKFPTLDSALQSLLRASR